MLLEPKLQLGVQRFRIELGVAKNLGEQAPANGLTRMYRDYGCPAIRMLDVMMAAPDPNYLEAESLQGCHKFLACEAGKSRHRETLMRCTPTKLSFGAGTL